MSSNLNAGKSPPPSNNAGNVAADSYDDSWERSVGEVDVATDVLKADEESLANDVVKEWETHSVDDLRLRHRTGQRLNLVKEASRGLVVAAHLAKRLEVSPSDISRMTAFARKFSTFEDFTAAHPEIKRWTQVKAILPGKPAVEKPKFKKPLGTWDDIRDALFTAMAALKEYLEMVKDTITVKELREMGALADQYIAMVEVLKQDKDDKGSSPPPA